MKKLKIYLILLVSLFVLKVQAEEKILFFHSDIEVQANGNLLIIETIKVRAEARKILSGIYRVLPTKYKAKYGLDYKVSYNFLEVLKDGVEEPTEEKFVGNEVKLYIGDPYKFIRSGDYTYTIKYETSSQLSHYEDNDELYWNVNGNFWDFKIDSISTLVTFPEKTEILQYNAYTGSHGMSESNYQAEIVNGNQIFFVGTKQFQRNEGITIAVAIPKGNVIEEDRFIKLLKDNIAILVALFGLILMLLFYLLVWSRVGIDPPKGVIHPRFEAPKGLSPAAVRYINEMAFDKKAYTASVIDLAIKGHLQINKNESNDFSIKLLNKENVASKSESKMIKAMFRSGSKILNLKQSNHSRIQNSITTLELSLKKEVESTYFNLNNMYLWFGILIAVPFLMFLFLSVGAPDPLFGTIWMCAWTILCLFSLKTTISSLKQKNIATGLGMTLLSISFIFIWFVSFSKFGKGELSLPIVICVSIFVLIVVLFNYLLKAPTIMGRKVMDEIEGFQMHLKTGELSRMELVKTTEENIKLFEKFLPYAVALDCETEWTKKFQKIIDDAIAADSYKPIWCGANYHIFNTLSIGSSLASSLNSTITTTSRAPSSGSSGGYSGGGFSGGGGW